MPRVLQVQRDQRALALREIRVPLVQREKRDQRVLLDPPVLLEPLARRELRVQRVPRDPLDLLDQPVLLVKREQLDLLDLQDQRVPRVPRVIQDQRVQRGLVLREIPVPLVLREKRVQRVPLDPRVPLDQRGRLVEQVERDLPVRPVQPVLQVRRVPLV